MDIVYITEFTDNKIHHHYESELSIELLHILFEQIDIKKSFYISIINKPPDMFIINGLLITCNSIAKLIKKLPKDFILNNYDTEYTSFFLIKNYDNNKISQKIRHLTKSINFNLLKDDLLSHINDEKHDVYKETKHRSKIIFKERYIQELTLEQIGSKHGITRERVRQICSKQEKKLKEKCLTSTRSLQYIQNISQLCRLLYSSKEEKDIKKIINFFLIEDNKDIPNNLIELISKIYFPTSLFLSNKILFSSSYFIPIPIENKNIDFNKVRLYISEELAYCNINELPDKTNSIQNYLDKYNFIKNIKKILIQNSLSQFVNYNNIMILKESRPSVNNIKKIIFNIIKEQKNPIHYKKVHEKLEKITNYQFDERSLSRYIDEHNNSCNIKDYIYVIGREGYILWDKLNISDETAHIIAERICSLLEENKNEQYRTTQLFSILLSDEKFKNKYITFNEPYYLLAIMFRVKPCKAAYLGRWTWKYGIWKDYPQTSRRKFITEDAIDILRANGGVMEYSKLMSSIRKARMTFSISTINKKYFHIFIHNNIRYIKIKNNIQEFYNEKT